MRGGKPGASARTWLNHGTARQERLPSKFMRVFPQDSVVRGEMAASGGYGDPLERDPTAVHDDVRQEKISVQHALEAYGVVVRGEKLALDREATATERLRRKRST